MGAQGRDFALSRFDAKVMIDALERVYANAVGTTLVSPSS